MKKFAQLAVAAAALGVMGGGPQVAHAQTFYGFGFAPGAKGRTIDYGGTLGERSHDSTNYVKATAGMPLGGKLNAYGQVAITPISVDESQTSDEFVYSYRIFNAGVGYNVTDNLIAYGGLGYSYEVAEAVYLGTHYTSVDSNSRINLNGGALYNVYGKFGVGAGFDSASGTITANVVYGLGN